jgi:uncharacterized protein (DUF1684 family)
MTMTRNAARAALLAAVLLATGCSGSPSMWPSTPPTDWAPALAAERADKDRQFAADQESPLRPQDRVAFKGLDYWAADPTYRFSGFVSWFAAPEPLTIITTTGKERPAEKVGRISFDVGATRCVLTVLRLLDQDRRTGGAGLLLPFMDKTSGRETYPAGRYIELEGPEGGPFVLDFNKAYNPYCAYGAPERYRCPVTPAENKLDVRIEAGERGFRHEDGRP